MKTNPPMPQPKPNSTPEHTTAVLQAWSAYHYGHSDPRIVWRRIVGDRPSWETLKTAMAEHKSLYAVVRSYQPPAGPAVDRAAIERQWNAALAERTGRGMTRYAAMLDIQASDRALWAAKRGL
jgi:hypothetical protein